MNDHHSTNNFETLTQLEQLLQHYILGQNQLINRLMIALLTNGHLLVEGAPGLAKTTAIKTLAEFIEGNFHRIQFTPDLLPADVTGTEIYRSQTASFEFQPGPIFHNLVLADEINRAPAKVQSALLEAMGEHQITVGKTTYQLPKLFMVMATQNPIEQEGTYPLPEAQLDRFLLHIIIDYPDPTTEQAILQLARKKLISELNGLQEDASIANKKSNLLAQVDIFEARKEVASLHIAPQLEEYIVQLILATRTPKLYGEDLAKWISYGASPRGTIALDCCAKAHAFLANRDYVSPEDIHTIAHDVLRHRVLLSYEAEAEGITVTQVIAELINRVPVP